MTGPAETYILFAYLVPALKTKSLQIPILSSLMATYRPLKQLPEKSCVFYGHPRFNTLTHWPLGDIEVILQVYKPILRIDILNTSCEIGLR